MHPPLTTLIKLWKLGQAHAGHPWTTIGLIDVMEVSNFQA